MNILVVETEASLTMVETVLQIYSVIVIMDTCSLTYKTLFFFFSFTVCHSTSLVIIQALKKKQTN